MSKTKKIVAGTMSAALVASALTPAVTADAATLSKKLKEVQKEHKDLMLYGANTKGKEKFDLSDKADRVNEDIYAKWVKSADYKNFFKVWNKLTAKEKATKEMKTVKAEYQAAKAYLLTTQDVFASYKAATKVAGDIAKDPAKAADLKAKMDKADASIKALAEKETKRVAYTAKKAESVKSFIKGAEDLAAAKTIEEADKALETAKTAIGGYSATFINALTAQHKVLVEGKLAVPAVSSVNVVNAKKIEVKFTQPVVKSEAVDGTKYNFVGIDTTSATYELSEDEKTVTVKLANKIANDTTFVATVSEITSKADAKVKTAKYTTTLKFSDTIRPEFKNVTYPKQGVAELNFSEELSTMGTVKVYDGLQEVSSVTPTLDGDKVVLTGLELNKTYKVVITGAKDQSENIIAAPIEVEVKNTIDDKVVPTVSSITSVGIDTVKVQFSEAIKEISSGKYVTFAVNTVEDSSATQTFDAKTNTLTISGITGINDKDVKSITISGYSDLAGNNGASFTKVLAFTTAAPVLQKTEVVKEGTDTFAVLTFDKAIATSSIQATGDKVTAKVVTPENVHLTKQLDIVNDESNKQLKIKVTGEQAGSYSVDFAAGKLTDGTTANKEVVTVTFSVAASADVTKPLVNDVTISGETVTVTYSKEMSQAALNTDNYTVSGQKVFGSAYFDGSTKVVKLTLKDGAIKYTGEQIFAIGTAVTAGNGVAIDAYSSTKTFNENVKPVLTSGAVIDANTIELTFSELLGTKGFDTATDDFEVTIGGVKNVVSAIVDGTVKDNKVRLTLTTPITADQLTNSAVTISVKTLDTTDIVDLVDNKLTANTVISVSK